MGHRPVAPAHGSISRRYRLIGVIRFDDSPRMRDTAFMADPATFGHDKLGHLLSDKLLEIPRFQRRYSWKEEHVHAYLEDIETAKGKGNSYFMGTIVLANAEGGSPRILVVDGQQRIITTALMLIAVRDLLADHGKQDAARAVEETYLDNYVLAQEKKVERLVVGPDDLTTYRSLLDRAALPAQSSALQAAYRQIHKRLFELSPSPDSYRIQIDIVTYLNENLQVLVATATGLAEAYVIFETLNDRGADLTTADLLKNYLFSRADASIAAAEGAWSRIGGDFEKPDDFVKFLRYEYMSRVGPVTQRGLYKGIQQDFKTGTGVLTYLSGLEQALASYRAVREPDDISWSSEAIDVKDSLLAFRRFGFESSMPLMIAVFRTWKHPTATKFVSTVAAWSVRAWFAGTLGGGVAEQAFCEAAVAVAKGQAKDPASVLAILDSKELIPDDASFRQAFRNAGSVTTTRAKYLLAMLERQFVLDAGGSPDALPDWSSKAVTIEHIFAKSMKEADFHSRDDFERYEVVRDQLMNYTLLERSLNQGLENLPFSSKYQTYAKSKFTLTQALAQDAIWNFQRANTRLDRLVELALKAWPKAV